MKGRHKAELARLIDETNQVIKDEEIAKIGASKSVDLVRELIDRLMPILTNKRPVRYMSIPVDYRRDDDVYCIERLRELRRRLSQIEEHRP